jgi:hypothetical protein
MCVRNMLATYEELWMLEWRDSLESMMTGYFERFEVTPLCTVTKTQVGAQRVYGDVVVPFGPLPEGEGIAGAMLPCPTPLHVEQHACVVSAITPAQRLRDATALIFGNVIDESVSLIQPCVDHCDAFASACGWASVVEQVDVLRALMRAEVSISLNFGIPAAVQWAGNFLFPTEVWERDGMALLRHDMSLESLLFLLQ